MNLEPSTAGFRGFALIFIIIPSVFYTRYPDSKLIPQLNSSTGNTVLLLLKFV